MCRLSKCWSRWCGVGRAVALALVWFTVSAPAMANVLILDSNVESVPAHQELGDDRRLDIPVGGQVVVLLSQDGAVKQVAIKGPRAGTVKELLKPQPVPNRVWSFLRTLVQTGGADQSGTVGTRGRRAHRLDINGASFDAGDVICVEEGTPPTIALAGSGVLRVSADHGAHYAPLEAASGRATWPSSVAIRDNGVYQFADQSSRFEVTVRVVPKGTLGGTSVQTLDELETHGCLRQLAAAMHKLVEQP
jgi:hypothetical protein